VCRPDTSSLAVFLHLSSDPHFLPAICPPWQVFVKYIGSLKKNGKVFDSNMSGRGFKFRLGQCRPLVYHPLLCNTVLYSGILYCLFVCCTVQWYAVL